MKRINEASNFYKHTSHEACGSAKLEIHAGGSGVIFYNSASSTIYNGNTKMEKISLDFTIKGVKGLWKLK